MLDAWQPQIRKLALTNWGESHRIIALAGIDAQSGVSTLCGELAAFSARSGRRTALLDMARPVAHAAQGWRLDTAPDDATTRDDAGFHRIAVACAEDGQSLSDIGRLRGGID